MADIKAIKGTNGTTYSIVDRFSEWGGYNLFKNVKRTTSPTAYLANAWNLSENMIQGEVYTLQLWGVTLSRSDKTAPWIRPYWGGGSVAIATNLYPDENGYVCCTFTAPVSTHATVANPFINFYNSPGVGASGTTYNMVIEKAKLEKGYKATDWSPCWADIFTYANNTITMNI